MKQLHILQWAALVALLWLVIGATVAFASGLSLIESHGAIVASGPTREEVIEDYFKGEPEGCLLGKRFFLDCSLDEDAKSRWSFDFDTGRLVQWHVSDRNEERCNAIHATLEEDEWTKDGVSYVFRTLTQAYTGKPNGCYFHASTKGD